MCSLLPESWQCLCSVPPFHRWLLLHRPLCLSYMNSPSDPCWPQITSKEQAKEESKPQSQWRKVPFKTPSKPLLIRVIHPGLSKCHSLASFICITSKTTRCVCSALIYPLAWVMLPLLTQSSKREQLQLLNPLHSVWNRSPCHSFTAPPWVIPAHPGFLIDPLLLIKYHDFIFDKLGIGTAAAVILQPELWLSAKYNFKTS